MLVLPYCSLNCKNHNRDSCCQSEYQHTAAPIHILCIDEKFRSHKWSNMNDRNQVKHVNYGVHFSVSLQTGH